MALTRNVVYALVEREFLQDANMVVKVGMTSKPPFIKRLANYSKQAQLLAIHATTSRHACIQAEKDLIGFMRSGAMGIKQRKDIGSETFEYSRDLAANVHIAMCTVVAPYVYGKLKEPDSTESETDTTTTEPEEPVEQAEPVEPVEQAEQVEQAESEEEAEPVEQVEEAEPEVEAEPAGEPVEPVDVKYTVNAYIRENESELSAKTEELSTVMNNISERLVEGGWNPKKIPRTIIANCLKNEGGLMKNRVFPGDAIARTAVVFPNYIENRSIGQFVGEYRSENTESMCSKAAVLEAYNELTIRNGLVALISGKELFKKLELFGVSTRGNQCFGLTVADTGTIVVSEWLESVVKVTGDKGDVVWRGDLTALWNASQDKSKPLSTAMVKEYFDAKSDVTFKEQWRVMGPNRKNVWLGAKIKPIVSRASAAVHAAAHPW